MALDQVGLRPPGEGAGDQPEQTRIHKTGAQPSDAEIIHEQGITGVENANQAVGDTPRS
jgi:hypothetical protein